MSRLSLYPVSVPLGSHSVITVPIGATFTKLAPIVHLDMIYWCHLAYILRLSDQDTKWQ